MLLMAIRIYIIFYFNIYDLFLSLFSIIYYLLLFTFIISICYFNIYYFFIIFGYVRSSYKLAEIAMQVE